ncbi:MAG: pirin family protein [Rhodospirillales bacterium]|nr:pirin family protein [Rhodospirillales bacterium]
MIEVSPRESMGRNQVGWLDATHHFSFGDYHDPTRINFGPLRVWNDDLFRSGGGFPMHPHKDMEIITFVHRGEISHADSLGNGGTVGKGDVQVMSAGTGIVHSEFNNGPEDLELFQIWILPDAKGHAPRWETRQFSRQDRKGRLVELVSGRTTVAPGSLRIHQDAALFATDLEAGETVTHPIEPGRRAYAVAIDGRITINGVRAPARAGIQATDEDAIVITAEEPGQVVVLDLP